MVWPEGLCQWKIPVSDTTGNRAGDLPVCSAVPQPTAPPRAPFCSVGLFNLVKGTHVSEEPAAFTFRVQYVHTGSHSEMLVSICTLLHPRRPSVYVTDESKNQIPFTSVG
jgi:hypothetical protein